MLASTANGRPVVVDLKWYRTDSYVRRDLKLGTALQVGVYGRHISDSSVDVRVGYFMLRQSRFLTSDPGGRASSSKAHPLRTHGTGSSSRSEPPSPTWGRARYVRP